MAPQDSELVRLQLAMAFGQGAGTLLASPEALSRLLQEGNDLVDRARTDWSASRWAFCELMRILGQLAAAHAARDNSPGIEWQHIEESMPSVLGICPCFVPRTQA